jgi:hypothetical protein
MRWLDRAASSAIADDVHPVSVTAAGRRGWIVHVEIDRVDGEVPWVAELRFPSHRDAEDAVASIMERARQGDPADHLARLIVKLDHA